MVHAVDRDGMLAAWEALGQTWTATIDRARQLGEVQLHESVGGEWSFIDTLRHLLFAIDKWVTLPILGEDSFHRLGIPNTGSADFPWLGVDAAADPTLDDVLAARRDRSARLRDYLNALKPAELAREVAVLENGTTLVKECILTVFEEEFEHHRYAVRDLAQLD